MNRLLQFILRRPWIWVVVAFLILIAVWITAFILAGRMDTTEVPLSPPAHSSPATPTAKP